MLNVSLIINTYPLLHTLNTLGIQDMRLHLILPNTIDYKCSTSLWFYVSISNINVTNTTCLITFLFVYKLSIIDSFKLIFDKNSGNCIQQLLSSKIKVILNNSYIKIIPNILPSINSLLNYIIHPSCLLLLQLGPKLSAISSTIKCVGSFTILQNALLILLLNSDNILSLESGINTLIVYNDNIMSISGLVNNKLLDWGYVLPATNNFIFYWSDLLTKFKFKHPLEIYAKGLYSINGLTNLIYIKGSKDIVIGPVNTSLSASKDLPNFIIKIEKLNDTLK